MEALYSHEVVLIAPNGREQAALLKISKQGVALATPDKELNKFPFEVIVKWLPSSQRSRNPGAVDSLDLQIMTDKGPRDLRMRCRDAAEVQGVMQEIQATVQDVLQEEGAARSAALSTTSRGSGTSGTQPQEQAQPQTARQQQQPRVTFVDEQLASQQRHQLQAQPQTQTQQQQQQQQQPTQEPPSSSAPAPSQSQPQTEPQPRQAPDSAWLVGLPQSLPPNAAATAIPVTIIGNPPAGMQTVAPAMPVLAVQTRQQQQQQPVQAMLPAQQQYQPQYQQPVQYQPMQPPMQQQYAYQPMQQPLQPQQQYLPQDGGGLVPQPLQPAYPQYQPQQQQYQPQPYQQGDTAASAGHSSGSPSRAAAGALGWTPNPVAGLSLGVEQLNQLLLSNMLLVQGQAAATAAAAAAASGGGADPALAQLQQQRAMGTGNLRASPSRPAAAAEEEEEEEEGPGAANGGVAREARVQVQALSAEVEELQQQNEFLEGLVRRLAAEVSRRQGAAGERQGDPLDEYPPLPDDGLPLPAWLRDRRYLNPLLEAYDERVASLEGQLGQRADSLEGLQKQVEEVVTENDRLRAQLSELRQQREHAAPPTAWVLQAAGAAAAAGTAGSSGAGGQAVNALQERMALLLEENALLRHENDMLLTQQSGLDAELQRLHRAMEERAVDAVASAAESASAATRVAAAHEEAAARVAHALQTERQAQQAKKESEGKLSRTLASLRASEQRCAALEQELQAVQSRLNDESAGGAVARRALDDARAQCAALERELQGLGIRAREAREGQATLQVELTSLKERYEEAVAEVSVSHRQLEALRSGLANMEGRVVEHQRNDAEVYGRIKEAMEEAEQARLARDSALLGQRELQREVEVLKNRLASARQATRDLTYAELQGQLHEAAERSRQAQEEAAHAVQQAAELRTLNERLQREARSLGSELHATRANLEAGDGAGGSGGGGAAGGGGSWAHMSLMSLAAMEKIQELERSRDEAAQKLESTERHVERATRNWHLEKQALEIEVRELRQKLADAEGLLLSRRNEVVGLGRQVESLGRELQAASIARVRLEEEARLQASAVRAERDQEVRALASKLEATLAIGNRNLAEAERMIEAKEVMLAKWKEEAQGIAAKLERAVAEHRRQLGEQHMEATALSQQCEALQQDNAQLAAELGEARAAVAQLRSLVEDGDARGAALSMQLLAAQGREEELGAELRALSMALERARAAAVREARQGQGGAAGGDKLMAKYAALKQTAAVVAVASDGLT